MEAIKIRVNIAGYSGTPVSLYCAFAPGTDVLLVGRSGDYDGADRAGFLKISNVGSDAAAVVI